MLRAISVVAFVLPLMTLCGCYTVEVDHLFGEPVKVVDGRKLDGMWNLDGKLVHCKCAGEGKLILAGLEWDEKKDHFKLEESSVLLRRMGDHNFAVMAPRDAEENKSFFFMRYELADQNSLKLWAPNVRAFATAVENGELPGEVKKLERSVTVRLSATEEQLAEFFAQEHQPPLFVEAKDSPMTLTRVNLPGPKETR